MDDLFVSYSPFENVRYKPTSRQVWAYQDAQPKKSAQWEIVGITPEGMAHIVKVSGRDKGSKAEVPVDDFLDAQWKFQRGPLGAAPEFTFNCPGCEQPEPIPLGDYICDGCRRG